MKVSAAIALFVATIGTGSAVMLPPGATGKCCLQPQYVGGVQPENAALSLPCEPSSCLDANGLPGDGAFGSAVTTYTASQCLSKVLALKGNTYTDAPYFDLLNPLPIGPRLCYPLDSPNPPVQCQKSWVGRHVLDSNDGCGMRGQANPWSIDQCKGDVDGTDWVAYYDIFRSKKCCCFEDNPLKCPVGTTNATNSKLYCPAPKVDMLDDPHILGWGGNWFDYQGQCDLVFIDAPKFDFGLDLLIQARTTIRYDYSYISSAALRIGDDTLEVSSWGEYAVNGVESAKLSEVTLAGYPISYKNPDKKRHFFEIKVDVEYGTHIIQLRTFKDMVSISLDGVLREHVQNSVGILGNIDGRMLGRDGVTEFTDMDAFGQEWQVQADEPMLFRVSRAPQAKDGEKCQLPQMTAAAKSRRLGESMAIKTAEKACASFKGKRFENCVKDVLATGDVDIATAGAF